MYLSSYPCLVHMHLCMHVYLHVSTYILSTLCVCLYIHIRTSTHACMHTSVCTCCRYVYMHYKLHTHTYIALHWLSSSFLSCSCLAIIYVATVYTFFKLYLCNITIVSLQSILLKNTWPWVFEIWCHQDN